MMKRIARAWSLMFGLSFCLCPPAFAGDCKAEPLRIAFKAGTSTATVRGTARGDIQTEYAAAVRKGQWLLVEIRSTPLDAAVFTVTDPQGDSSSAQYAWSEIAPASGDYQITVSRPADYPACTFTLTVTASSRPAAIRTSAADKEGVALTAAMRRFISAFRKRDRAAFLACFSRLRPSYHLNPMNIGSRKYYRTAVSYSELASDLNQKKDWYWTYLERPDNGNLDAFIDNLPDSTMWTRVRCNKFVPPGAEIASPTYVQWRKEGARWVIHAISYPSA